MPSAGETYWMPDILPEPTEEYTNNQSKKMYLTPEGEERMHPGWTYAQNGALVDDDYLFYNEGWILVVNNVPEESPDYKLIVNNNHNDWVLSSDKKTITIPFKRYRIVDTNKPVPTFYQEIELLPEEDWTIDENELTISKKWTIVDLNSEEIEEKKNLRFEELRLHRNMKLQESDYAVVKCLEYGNPIPEAIKDYRQQLRDIPQIVDITTWDAQTYDWPVFPQV